MRSPLCGDRLCCYWGSHVCEQTPRGDRRCCYCDSRVCVRRYVRPHMLLVGFAYLRPQLCLCCYGGIACLRPPLCGDRLRFYWGSRFYVRRSVGTACASRARDYFKVSCAPPSCQTAAEVHFVFSDDFGPLSNDVANPTFVSVRSDRRINTYGNAFVGM